MSRIFGLISCLVFWGGVVGLVLHSTWGVENTGSSSTQVGVRSFEKAQDISRNVLWFLDCGRKNKQSMSCYTIAILGRREGLGFGLISYLPRSRYSRVLEEYK